MVLCDDGQVVQVLLFSVQGLEDGQGACKGEEGEEEKTIFTF